MSHAILISDHNFLSETIKVNLQTFLSCKTVVIKDVPTLMQLVSVDQTYDFILCLSTIAKRDISSEVYKVHQKYIKNVPLVFLGHVNETPFGVFNVINPFEIITILRIVSKELGWKAKDLISRVTPDYIPIPMTLIRETKIAIDDLYWKTESTTEPFVLIAKHNEPIEAKLVDWSKNKVQELFIKAENRLRAMGDLNKYLINSINASLDNPQVSDVSKIQDSAVISSQYFSDPESLHQFSEEVRVELGKLAVKTTELVTKIMNVMPSNLNKMIELFQKTPSEFIPRHSFLATYFAIEMIKAESWYSDQVDEKICMLLYFHDLILLPIYQKHINLPNDEQELLESPLLSDKEKQIIRWHPKLMAGMVADIPGLPVGLDQLILQHHGTLNGDIASKEIQEEVSLLAKVVMIAEHFTVELLKSKLPLKNESRELILRDMGEKFKKRSYFKLLSYLERFEV